jgi:hypothetical protein
MTPERRAIYSFTTGLLFVSIDQMIFSSKENGR